MRLLRAKPSKDGCSIETTGKKARTREIMRGRG